MTYYSTDPRESIRNTIGYTLDYNSDNVDESVVSVTDSYGDYVYLPLLLPEETRAGKLYPMPFIEMLLVTSPARVHNVQGDVREQKSYIDFHVWYTNQDNISATTFGKKVGDRIVDLIMTYRHSVPSVYWMEVLNDGREIVEEVNNQVVFHRILEVYTINWR